MGLRRCYKHPSLGVREVAAVQCLGGEGHDFECGRHLHFLRSGGRRHPARVGQPGGSREKTTCQKEAPPIDVGHSSQKLSLKHIESPTDLNNVALELAVIDPCQVFPTQLVDYRAESTHHTHHYRTGVRCQGGCIGKLFATSKTPMSLICHSYVPIKPRSPSDLTRSRTAYGRRWRRRGRR